MDCGQQTNFDLVLLLVSFALVFSILGFRVVIAFSLAFERHKRDIIMILYYWDKMEFKRHPLRPILFVNVLRYFYEITTAIFAVLFLYYLSQAWPAFGSFYQQSIPLMAFIPVYTFLCIEIFYRLHWERYFRENRKLIEILRHDIEGYYRRDWDKWFKDPDFSRKIIEDARERRSSKESYIS